MLCSAVLHARAAFLPVLLRVRIIERSIREGGVGVDFTAECLRSIIYILNYSISYSIQKPFIASVCAIWVDGKEKKPNTII